MPRLKNAPRTLTGAGELTDEQMTFLQSGHALDPVPGEVGCYRQDPDYSAVRTWIPFRDEAAMVIAWKHHRKEVEAAWATYVAECKPLRYKASKVKELGLTQPENEIPALCWAAREFDQEDEESRN